MTKLCKLLAFAILSFAFVTHVNAWGDDWEESELRFLDLVAAAEAGANVTDVFIRNYSHKTVLFLTPYLGSWAGQKNLLLVDGDLIRIRDFKIVTKVLNLFGKHILKLYFNQIDDGGDFNVTDLVNLQCADSVTELTVNTIEPHKEFFSGLAPFKKVETLKLQGFIQSLDSPTHKFNERFPSLKNLTFMIANVTDGQSFSGEFSHLQRLDLYFYTADRKMREHFKKLIATNPRIKNLFLVYSEREFIKFITENLRQLDELRLLWKEENDIPDLEDVHFGSVKALSIASGEMGWLRPIPISAPKNMYFNNLESLNVDSFNKNPQTWMNLVANSTQLRQLQIQKDLGENVLTQLSPLGPRLNYFDAEIYFDVQDETMLAFLKSHRALLKVQWKRYGGFKTLAKLIRKEIGYAWKITLTKSTITLERQF